MNFVLSRAIFEDQTKYLNGRLLDIRSWKINQMSHPILDVTFLSSTRKSFRVRLMCQRYNEFPASIELLSEDGKFLATVPSGCGVINGGAHPATGRPFICSPGSLEYHTHGSHLSDLWDHYKHKPSFDLGGILTQIYNAWNKTTDAP